MARPNKPTVLKVLSGTNQPCRDVDGLEFEPLAKFPKAPTVLPNSHATKEWNRLGPILFKNGLLTDASLGPFIVLCTTYGLIIQQSSAGVGVQAALLTQYLSFVREFGLTPAAAGKVKAPGPGKKANPFANNGK